MPSWHPISISGYHIREAGSTAIQEVAFTCANAIAYVEAAIDAGLDINTFGRRLSFFFAAHSNFLEEIAKFRKNKFLIESGTSYDELYIINTKGLEIDEVDHMGSVQAGSSKAEIRKALKKNTKGKLQNRILLNAFIEKVA